MDIFTIIIVIFFIAILFLIIKLVKSVKFGTKSNIVKKSEIIDGYKKHIDTLNTKEEKIDYIKEINQELARNIFFDQDELKDAIQTLTTYSIR